jgi:hypothetical protein
MNYIKEINSFYDWLETNSVSDSAITLWHALMHINNKAGWKVEFTVASSVLCLKSGLSQSSFKRARNILKQSGRIEWRERKGNQSAIYNLISFAVQYEPQTAPQSEPQSEPQTAPQSEPINKLNINKTKPSFKKEAKEEILPDTDSEEFFPEDKSLNEETKEKSSAKKEKFKIPTDVEVQKYCDERQNGISGFSFVNFYQSKGWKVGDQQMKDWQAAVRTWESKNKNNGQSNSNNTNAGFSNQNGNSNGGAKIPGKKSASTILAERARKQFAGDCDSGNQTTET